MTDRPIGSGKGRRAPLAVCGAVLGWIIALGWTPLPARAFEEADVSAIVGNQKNASDFPGSGGVWMGRDRQITIDGYGTTMVIEHMLARVFDPAWAKRKFSPYRRVFNASLGTVAVDRARVWHSRTDFTDIPRGDVTDSAATVAQGLPAFAYLRDLMVRFPEVRAGDVIELKLRWDLPLSRFDTNFKWVEETFGAEDPVVEQQLSIAFPSAAGTEIRTLGPQVSMRTYNEGNTRRAVWLTGNIPPLPCRLIETPLVRVPVEPDSAGPQVSRALFTNASDWGALSEALGAQWEHAWNQRSPDMDAVVRGALTGSDDPVERALALERYVQKEVRTIPIPNEGMGSLPSDAALVVAQRLGSPRDKDCLLTSLLRSAGLLASPVWVRTRGGLWDPNVASPSQLDRFLVWVRVPGHPDLWLDPVEGAGAFPPSRALILNGGREGPLFGGPDGLVPFPGTLSRGAGLGSRR